MFNRISLIHVALASEIVILFCDEFHKRCVRVSETMWEVTCFGHVRNHDWAFEEWSIGKMTTLQVHVLCGYACSPDDEVRVAF